MYRSRGVIRRLRIYKYMGIGDSICTYIGLGGNPRQGVNAKGRAHSARGLTLYIYHIHIYIYI